MSNFSFGSKTAGPTANSGPSASLVTPVIAALVILAVVVGALIELRNHTGSTTSSTTSHLLYLDSGKGQLAETDSAGKTFAKVSYPQNSYPNVEAVSPSGGVLLSQGVGSPSEDYLLAKDGKTEKLSADAVKVLSTAVSLNRSHHGLFTDENNLVLATCVSGSNCKIVSLNIFTGTVQEIISDTGVAYSQLPTYIYPVALSADASSVYVRTFTPNKLGKEDSGLYKIDLGSHKVLNTYKLSQDSGYSLALSPDKKKAVYVTSGNNVTLVHVLDLATNKDTTAKWSKGAIADQPSVFQWSPDSKKVLFQASDSILPRQNFDDTKPTELAYLDVAKNQLTSLQTIEDSAHHNVLYLAWLDNKNVVYELQTSAQTYDFSSASAQINKLDIGSKKVSQQPAPGGDLAQVAFW